MPYPHLRRNEFHTVALGRIVVIQDPVRLTANADASRPTDGGGSGGDTAGANADDGGTRRTVSRNLGGKLAGAGRGSGAHRLPRPSGSSDSGGVHSGSGARVLGKGIPGIQTGTVDKVELGVGQYVGHESLIGRSAGRTVLHLEAAEARCYALHLHLYSFF